MSYNPCLLHESGTSKDVKFKSVASSRGPPQYKTFQYGTELSCAHESTKDDTVLSADCVVRSLIQCRMEHSPGLVPSLIALCIAHWFTNLSALSRYNKPDLYFGVENINLPSSYR